MKSNILLISFLIIALSAFSQGNNGLVAHWNFNGNANDVSGHNLNGVVTGATLTAGYNGIANTAYRFNGSSNRIDVAYNSLLSMDSFSICVLVKPMGFYNGICQGNTIIGRGNQTPPASDHYYLDFDDNTYDGDCNVYTLSHECFGGSTHSSSSPSGTLWYSDNDTVTLNTWYCVTITYSGDSMRSYINGTLRKTLYFPDAYSAGTDSLGIGYFAAGLNNGYPFWFNGVIDDIRLYNRPLPAAQVVQYCDTAKMLPTDVPVITNTAPEIIISPNPAHNSINIYLADYSAGSKIELINTMGQVISEMKPNSSSVNLDISMLPAGVYILRAECNRQVVFRKFLKQ